LRHAAANVFISRYVQAAAERRYPGAVDPARTHVIYNGVSGEWLERAAREPNRYDGAPRLVAVQSAARHKDNPTLIATLAALTERAPEVDWQLRIAGGSGRGSWDDVRQLAERLGVGSRVHFLGHLDPGPLEAEFRAALCLVFTSVLEAFGLPPIEAMACRCPAVAARITAMPEVIADAGMLVEPRQPRQFADAVWGLWESPARRAQLVEAGLRQSARFSWDESARQFYQVFEQALAAS
jgi:glycosyltransferase involved in cell wall biosynthesis